MKLLNYGVVISMCLLVLMGCSENHKAHNKAPEEVLSEQVYERLNEQYDFIDYFYEDLAIVGKGEWGGDNAFFGKYGFIDANGTEIIPCKFDEAQRFSNGLAAVESDDLWGYINTQGKTVIPMHYEYATDFHDGVAVVNSDGRWYGIPDTDASYFVGGSWFLIDNKGGKLKELPYDFIRGFDEKGLAEVIKIDGVSEWGPPTAKSGYIDTNGKEIVPCKNEYYF